MKNCKYNDNQIADRECKNCGEGLCSEGSCGVWIENGLYCNECAEDSKSCHESHLKGGCYSCKAD